MLHEKRFIRRTMPCGMVRYIFLFSCGHWLALGPLTGFAMNPARDFGPRLFLLMSGWGDKALGTDYYGLIVPIFATIAGGLIAGALYKNAIGKRFI